MIVTEKEISVIIPAYNSASCIARVLEQVNSVLTAMNVSFEIIVVDDCSKDGTWLEIKKTVPSLSHTRAYRLAKNFGQHRATLCGFHHCTGNYVITIDDDLEHNPKDIAVMYQHIKQQNNDVVYVTPLNVKKSWIRRSLTSFYKFISKVENPYAGTGSSFRILTRALVNKITSHHSHLFFIDEIILWYTSSIGLYEAQFHKSQKSVSGYSYGKLVLMSSRVLMISSTMPLKIVKFLGFSVSTVSFIAGLFYFLKKIIFGTQEGFTTIIIAILFSTGLILFCIGVIGEYLGNVLMMQSNKPAFFVKEEL